MQNSKIKVEETNLEDLIVLGEECHIPVSIEFPRPDGEVVRAKALIKQITVKEMKKLKLKGEDKIELAIDVLKIALLKQNESNFTREEILYLPLGVLTKLSDKILELSGFDINDELRNF